MRTLLPLCSVFLASGCQAVSATSTPPEDTTPPEASAPAEDLAPVNLRLWGSETIKLPPGFAPELPEGRETILFAPGWSRSDAEDHWSYVLLIEVEEVGYDARRLESFFELYFDGLIAAVGQGKPFDLPDDPAKVSFSRAEESWYTGIVETFDAFGSGNALTLHLLVEVELKNSSSSILRVQASPTEPGMGRIWSSMDQAIRSLTFE